MQIQDNNQTKMSFFDYLKNVDTNWTSQDVYNAFATGYEELMDEFKKRGVKDIVKEAEVAVDFLGKSPGMASDIVEIVGAVTSENPEYEIPKQITGIGGAAIGGYIAAIVLSPLELPLIVIGVGIASVFGDGCIRGVLGVY